VSEEEVALSVVLDTIIPESSERGMPGAGAIGLAEAVRKQAPELGPVIDAGLAAVDEVARKRGADDFASLSPADRAEVLSAVAGEQPAFVPSLLFFTYRAYYQHPRVLEALGLEPRPPHPKGYEVGPDDFTLLERVRARPKLYRDC
jgi:hypothetical protein